MAITLSKDNFEATISNGVALVAGADLVKCSFL